MSETQACRLTLQVPLVRLEGFSRSLEQVLADLYIDPDLALIWRRHISAECPRCGILVCGEELRALAFTPCPELASLKLGRLRLGDCARTGCESWHYDVHLWHQEGIDWAGILEAAENLARPPGPRRSSWFYGLRLLSCRLAPRASAFLSLLVVLWLVRQLYQGGRIPFFREPEDFNVETPMLNSAWPPPMDGSDKLL
jgi:hypothetical protein